MGETMKNHRSKRIRTGRGLIAAALWLILIVAFSGMTQAKTTRAKTGRLKNVTKAEEVTGRFRRINGKGKFRTEDGTWIKNKWIRFNGDIYYMNASGERVNGWVLYRNKKYYMRKCRLQVSTWFRSGPYWYYAGPKGYILKNRWIETGEGRYYVDAKGRRVTGEQVIDGKRMVFGADGKQDPYQTIDPEKPMLALTFDDGPSPYTERLLNCLEQYHARATFFMVGYCVANRPATVRRMASLNCELGNHSDTHPHMTSLSSAQVAAQFSACSSKIYQATGQYPTVCRLPYGAGAHTQWVLNATGLPSIYWSCDTQDWIYTKNPSHTVSLALANAKNGAIIPMHDLHQSTVIACETIIPALIRQGYQLVTVSELAKYKGHTTLHAGTTYSNFF